ncbi:hypothetical protein DFH28DRAFT_922508 [Melampsora americana]|nr:hypothetical protein DFH28DRAFT_922508 [Melampsora americana]
MNFKPLNPPNYQLNLPKPILNLNLFRNSPNTQSRSLNQIKSSNSRISNLCQKFFTRLACGAADKRKYNFMDFDRSSGMSQSSLLTLNPTRSFKIHEDIKPMHQEQDRPMSIDENLAIKFDNVKSDKEIISPSPSTRLSLSESTRTDDDDSDQDEPFSFYADDGKSIRGLTMSSPARFPTPENHE